MSKPLTHSLSGIGNLTKDPTVTKKTSKSNDEYYSIMIPVAVNTSYKKGNEVISKSHYYTLFGTSKKNPEGIMKFLKKGDLVYFEGEPDFSIREHEEKHYPNVTVQLEKFNLTNFEENGK